MLNTFRPSGAAFTPEQFWGAIGRYMMREGHLTISSLSAVVGKMLPTDEGIWTAATGSSENLS